MEKEVFDFLKKFADSPSPSGFEQPAQRVWREYVKTHVDRVESDVMGNTWGILEKKGAPRVMLAGHCDEVGLMVRYVDDDGFIYFGPIGGVDAHLLPGSRVVIHGPKGKVKGVIGRKPIHLIEDDERTKVSKLKDLYIDIGAKNRDDVMEIVDIGDPVTFTSTVEKLRGENVMGRGFDDKVGSMIVAEVLRRLSKQKSKLKYSVYGVSTVQEEVGLRGAHTSTFGIDPQIGICVEVTFSMDHPGTDKKTVGDVRIGRGPCISRGANINHKLFDLLKETAKENEIPLQLEAAPRGTGTDANVMQLTRSGVATALVQIPLRYMHTSSEVINLDDVENVIKLLVATLLKLSPKTDWKPE